MFRKATLSKCEFLENEIKELMEVYQKKISADKVDFWDLYVQRMINLRLEHQVYCRPDSSVKHSFKLFLFL